MRIVICDAHRVFADALASLLRAAGHEIAGSVLDLDQATELLSREPIEACVIDLRAPDPGKRPEIEKVVAGFPDTAFIALSGSADPSSLRHAMTSGVQGVAMKGDDFGEFVRVLTEAVPNRGSSRAQVLSSSARAALRRGEGAAAGPAQFLTDRERETLARLVRGESTADMAEAMGVRVSPARTHIDSVLSKLGAHSRLEAVAYAVREGLVDMSGWEAEQRAVGT